MPKELQAALAKNKKAKINFKAFPPSAHTMFLRWIARAKLQETREKRIKVVLEKAKRNDKNWG